MSTSAPRLKPTGWMDPTATDAGKMHWFGADGRALCGKWANFTWNTLATDDEIHPDDRCAACNRKYAKLKPAG